eukprot:jgi/Ulvmu1/8763/UM048_0018.1
MPPDPQSLKTGMAEARRIAATKYKVDRASPTGWLHKPPPPPVSIPVDHRMTTQVKGPTDCAKEFVVHSNRRLAIPYSVRKTGYKDPGDPSNRLDPFFYRTTNSFAFSPYSERKATVEGVTLPARAPTAVELASAQTKQRKEHLSTRRNHFPSRMAPPHQHYMTYHRLSFRPVVTSIEQVNPGIASQVAVRERRRIQRF